MDDAPHTGPGTPDSSESVAARIAEFVSEVSGRLSRPEGPFVDAEDAAEFFERKARLFALLAAPAVRGAIKALDQADRYAQEAPREYGLDDRGGDL